VDVAAGRLQGAVEEGLWPLVETCLGSHEAAGLALAVVREGEVVARGFGARDLGTGAPVTPETMFHLASVSKPFVATAIVSLATGPSALDLDAPVTDWVSELTLADGRADEVTARGLLSHTSGLPDVSDYGWHDPQLGDDALSDFARSLSGWRLQAEPGSAYSYSNAGYELLGLLLARVTGTTFEEAAGQRVLAPLGMRHSTFLRAEVPAHLAAAPHVGMPLSVPGDAYPYTRRHAPSSSLHSNLVEMCRWMVAHLDPTEGAVVDAGLRDLMWRPVVAVGEPPWEEAMALGWAVGGYRGQRTVSHGGMDPGFESMLVLVPEQRTGVVVLANANTLPMWSLAKVALDVALADVLTGESEGVAAIHRLAALEPVADDLDDDGFTDAVWGAIELHRTDMVWPLLRRWTGLRPESSAAWTMTGWAHQVDGEPDLAKELLSRALALDPDNDEAARLLRGPGSP